MCNKTEVAVGLSISLTGKFRPQGQQALQGIRLWQSYINAQGGIAVRNGENRSVRLIWYDDYSQIRFAQKNVFQLLRGDKVDILLGPYSSSLTMAVAEIAEEHKKVLWNYGGSSDEIFSHGRRYLVGIASPASAYLRALPHWLAEESPVLTRICVLYSAGGTFGWQVARGILESVLGRGRRIRESTACRRRCIPVAWVSSRICRLRVASISKHSRWLNRSPQAAQRPARRRVRL
jgi:branched-chain amino acid transport system substrate-binding protein